MPGFLGIDTSNYTTSAAIWRDGKICQAKKLLPVGQGAIGLRQSDAVFAHVKQLGGILEQAYAGNSQLVEAVGVSVSPRDEEGSYMPCFLVGELAGKAVSEAQGIPLYRFSHQAGHIAAALYSAGALELCKTPFLAFHISGGTTECLHVSPNSQHIFSIKTVARTLDLNAGQAIDRVGALLGLPFPAGPALEKLAGKSLKTHRVRTAFKGLDCCISGLENQCQKLLAQGENQAEIAKYCLTYIEATIAKMTEQVCAVYGKLPLVYAGGVMSNRQIRCSLETRFGGCFAQPEFSADNAAGAAVLCALRHQGVESCLQEPE